LFVAQQQQTTYKQALAAQLASAQEANRNLSAQLDAFEKQLAGILRGI